MLQMKLFSFSACQYGIN